MGRGGGGKKGCVSLKNVEKNTVATNFKLKIITTQSRTVYFISNIVFNFLTNAKCIQNIRHLSILLHLYILLTFA